MQAIDLKLTRYTIAAIWLITGLLTLCVFPQSESLNLLEKVGLNGQIALTILYGLIFLDISLGILTLTHPSKILWQIQATLIIVYSVIIAFTLSQYYIHPFGPILKNLPILLLLWFLQKYEVKTS